MAYKDEGCMDSRGRLIEQYQPLVFREALRWHVGEEHMADVLQEGNLGLIESVERYDYKLGRSFFGLCRSPYSRGKSSIG